MHIRSPASVPPQGKGKAAYTLPYLDTTCEITPGYVVVCCIRSPYKQMLDEQR